MKTIVVNPETYRKFLRRRAAANALSKMAEAFKTQLGLPEASKATVGEYLLVDGNNQPLGKATINPRDGYEVKPGFTLRVS